MTQEPFHADPAALWSMPKESTTELGIGRIVHYVSRGSADGVFPRACRPAMITQIGVGGNLGLVIFNPDGLFFHPLSKNGGSPCGQIPDPVPMGAQFGGPEPFETPGSWHWHWGCSTARKLGGQ